ncbi:MAG: sulfatase-like hydrolase/transferase [Rhodospirillales bacterium]|nr:sulfatase-like hydrolase/transferase [Rhodospirillales bacterium]MBO6787715.1 sulfatase-like hydrolase/transferase [Rhodospirillales bacterium]
MNSKPNVIYLTVDAVRADRTTMFGYERDTTPNLARLADDGLLLSNCHSLGPVTQMALIQLLTSTRPLSFGGYDNGAIGRPATIFRAFKDAGYHTYSLSTLHWVNRFFGYDDGVDNEFQLFSVITLPGVAFAMMRGTLRAYETGDIDADEAYRHLEPVLRNLFTNLVKYFENHEAQLPELEKYFADSAMMNSGYDHQKLLSIARRHEAELNAEGFGYVEKYLLPAPQGDEWMNRWLPKEWYYARHKSKLMSEFIHRASNKILRAFNPSLADARSKRFKIYTDAPSAIDRSIDIIRDSAASGEPFFLWSHFLDTHLPYVSGRGRTWYKETPAYLEALGYDPNIPPALAFKAKPENDTEAAGFSALYDAALRATDEHIGRVVDAVEQLGLADNTIIAVSGDHGEALGEHGHTGHFFRFNRVATHVPCVIRAPGVDSRNIGAFSCIMDIPATLADMAGIGRPEGWEGTNVGALGDGTRDSLLFESFYAGNCLFEHRPIYFAVRTHTHFLIWREAIDPSDKDAPARCELYDLAQDPQEQNNIYRDDHPALRPMEEVIARRMEEIPEIPAARIKKAFPWYADAQLSGTA